MSTKPPSAIGVIGTGDYAMALTKRLTAVGCQVLLGSRDPTSRQSTLYLAGRCLCDVEVTSIQRCVQLCDIVFLAIPADHFKSTMSQFSNAARGKIVVDVSNRTDRYAKISNAERLAAILPEAVIVKAFNTLDAASLDRVATGAAATPKVFLAGDEKEAKHTLSNLVQRMGFLAVDFGSLKSALYLEDFVIKVFTGWKVPVLMTFSVFSVWFLYIIYIYFMAKTAYEWEQIFLKVLNKPVCMTAITTVALTYLPGQLACLLQVSFGTKHRKFPGLLDGWLRSRRQMGIISYVLVVFHAVASTLMMSPTYYRSWYHLPQVTLPANLTSASASRVALPVSATWMIWKGEAALLFGIVAFLVMSALAVTSIPSVADSLNWSEWRFVHSKMGTALLLLSVTHVIVMGAPGWREGGVKVTVQSITFLSMLLPLLVLTLKLAFFLPPLRCYLRKIRAGWERDSHHAHRTAPDYRGQYLECVTVERFGGGAFEGGDDATEMLVRNSSHHVNNTPCCNCTKKNALPAKPRSSPLLLPDAASLNDDNSQCSSV